MARHPRLRFPSSFIVWVAAGGLLISACGGGSSPPAGTTAPSASQTGSPNSSATPSAQDLGTFDYEGAILTLAEVRGLLLTEGVGPHLDESVDGFTLKVSCGKEPESVYSVAGRLLQYKEAESRYIVNFSVRGFAEAEATRAFATQSANVMGCRGKFVETESRAKVVSASEENGILRFEFQLQEAPIRIIDYWMQSGQLVLQSRFVINDSTSAVPDSLWDQLRDAAVEKFTAAATAS